MAAKLRKKRGRIWSPWTNGGKIRQQIHRVAAQVVLPPEEPEPRSYRLRRHRARRQQRQPSRLIASVAIATYNKSSYLDRTLASIRAQNPPFPYELIVVDDGSTDDTRIVCKKYGANYHYLDHPQLRGPAVARNVSYRAARGGDHHRTKR